MFVALSQSRGVKRVFTVGHMSVMVVLKGLVVTNFYFLCLTLSKHLSHFYS